MNNIQYILNPILGICLLFLSNGIFAQSNLDVKTWFVQFERGEASPLQEVNNKDVKGNAGWKNRIYIQPEVVFQEIEGIGGAFNEIGGEALHSLPQDVQQQILQNLFSEEGAGFTFCRTAIGASDFGLDAYSYSMVPDDYNMKHFSIERDQKYVLPYIKGALAVNPNMTLFASPWSPPGWMKESGEMEGLKVDGNELKNNPKVYKAYADYFVKYVRAYHENGVDIDRICIQNENDADTKYPSCIFPAKEMVSFANDYLIPAFKKNKIKAKVYAGTFRVVNQMDLMDFVAIKELGEIDGVGIQYTDARFISDAQTFKPDLKIFHTEGHCYNGENSVEQAAHRLEEVANYINSGSTTFTYWNMILNETTKSGWGWTQNSLININRETGEVYYNPDYNAMYIISKFIKPGDKRIASVCRGKYPMISVKSPDGTIKVLIVNGNTANDTFELVVNDKVLKVNIPANRLTAVTILQKDI
ncbi:hypothetical protein V6R21_01175 [Limibacter armeniacum]|uniref:glycoside hydrolase family 30 protein n=1 Tax=Limibacter armeniacum TaxID=466084 RepID=UPI002FE5F395